MGNVVETRQVQDDSPTRCQIGKVQKWQIGEKCTRLYTCIIGNLQKSKIMVRPYKGVIKLMYATHSARQREFTHCEYCPEPPKYRQDKYPEPIQDGDVLLQDSGCGGKTMEHPEDPGSPTNSTPLKSFLYLFMKIINKLFKII